MGRGTVHSLTTSRPLPHPHGPQSMDTAALKGCTVNQSIIAVVFKERFKIK